MDLTGSFRFGNLPVRVSGRAARQVGCRSLVGAGWSVVGSVARGLKLENGPADLAAVVQGADP